MNKQYFFNLLNITLNKNNKTIYFCGIPIYRRITTEKNGYLTTRKFYLGLSLYRKSESHFWVKRRVLFFNHTKINTIKYINYTIENQKEIDKRLACLESDFYNIKEINSSLISNINDINSSLISNINDINSSLISNINSLHNDQNLDFVKTKDLLIDLMNSIYPKIYSDQNVINKWKYILSKVHNEKQENCDNIVLITDINYLKPTAITVSSILYNACCFNSKIRVNVIVSGNELINDENHHLDIFKPFKNFVNIIKINNEFTNIGKDHQHVTKASLLKFIIPNIFEQLDKILYIDSDIVVTNDLTELFNTDINNVYGAGVADSLIY